MIEKEKNPELSPEFIKLRKVAGAAVGRFRMIDDGDRILVGLSGGTDSFMLMHVLTALQRKAPIKFELIGATFDPGFPGFGTDLVAAYAEEQNWHFEKIGLDVAGIIKEKGFEKNPCVLCSRLRRGLLYKLSAQLECNKLALGHHADDVVTSLLMRIFRGQGIGSMAPRVAGNGGALTIVRPLVLTPEPLIKRAATYFNLPLDSKCPYEEFLDAEGDRAYFKRLLNELGGRIPDWRSLALRAMGRVEHEHLMVDPEEKI